MPADRVPVYLVHRLTTAAVDVHTDVQVFEPDAAKAIARHSGGVPRLINVLAHKCLMLAYGENLHRVNAGHVRLAARDTPGVAPQRPWWRRIWGRSASTPVRPLPDSLLGTPARGKP
jgi:MSHA biogenesis protein MshM